MMQNISRHAGRKRPRSGQLLDLAEADFDQGEFGCNEKTVRQHQKQDEDEFKSGHDGPGGATAG